MSRNRQIMVAACVVASLFSIWAIYRESNYPPEDDPEAQKTLSRRTSSSIRGGKGSAGTSGSAAKRREELLERYKLLWLELEEKDASREERSALARQTAREFMFGDEMSEITSFVAERRIRTGRGPLFDQLALLFHSDMASEARKSFLEHLDGLERFNSLSNILEQAGAGLSEDDFRIFHSQVSDLNPRYSVAVLRGRNIRQMKTEPLKTLESIFSNSRAAGSSEQSLEPNLMRRMLNQIPVGQDFNYQRIAELFSDLATDNPHDWGSLQSKIYYNWGAVDADSAYSEWQSHDGEFYTLRELTKGAVSTKSFEDTQLWLSRFTEPENRATAYTAAATQWAVKDATQAIFLANQIQEGKLREKAVRSVESVLAETTMRAEDR